MIQNLQRIFSKYKALETPTATECNIGHSKDASLTEKTEGVSLVEYI